MSSSKLPCLRHLFAKGMLPIPRIDAGDIQVLLNRVCLPSTHKYGALNTGELLELVMRHHPLAARDSDPLAPDFQQAPRKDDGLEPK